MAFGRLSAGLVVAGCLVAGVLGGGCAGADADEPSAGSSSDPALAGTITPIPTITVTPVPGPAPIFRPRIDNPAAACDALFDDSTFEGYLIELTGAETCPDISTSLGVWEEDPGDCLNSCPANGLGVGKAFYVGTAPAAVCRYKRRPSIFITYPPPTPQQRFSALATALGYPDSVSRDIVGILCAKAAAFPVAGAGEITSAAPESPAEAVAAAVPLAPIPVCRKCSQANANKVSLPTL
jgi:hypothetical protein